MKREPTEESNIMIPIVVVGNDNVERQDINNQNQDNTNTT